jgi:hypothetical protein
MVQRSSSLLPFAIAGLLLACAGHDASVGPKPRDMVQQFETVSGRVALDVTLAQTDTSVLARYVVRNTGPTEAQVQPSCWRGALLFDGLGRHIWPRHAFVCRAILLPPIRIAVEDSLVMREERSLRWIRDDTNLGSLAGIEAEVVFRLDGGPVRRGRLTLQ